MRLRHPQIAADADSTLFHVLLHSFFVDCECSTVTEVLWAFSIYLEAVAILPQLFMLQRTGEAETITAHYLFALGLYRGLYIPNWIYRSMTEDKTDGIALLAGIVQTLLYADFFWSTSPDRMTRTQLTSHLSYLTVYYQKCVKRCL